MNLSQKIGWVASDNVVYEDWDNWLAVAPPRVSGEVSSQEVSLRFHANGFDWDIHGTLLTPVGEMRKEKFILTHGGAGSEKEVLETPDGRPGLALVLAQQGYQSLAISFVGHYPKGGTWHNSAAGRMPVYLIDQDLPEEETKFRNLVCTFDVHVSGMAQLVDQVFDTCDLIVFGHSTGGSMVVAMHDHLKRNSIVGIVGWGSAEPTVWGREWDLWVNSRERPRLSLENMAVRTPDWFQSAGYVDPADLTPWGGAREYTDWADRNKSQFKTSLCENQLFGHIDLLYEYAAITKLPIERYLSYLRDPDPAWLSTVGVLLMSGEKDSRLYTGEHPSGLKRVIYDAFKYADRARRAKAIIVPRLGHFGFVALHNEKIAYTWIRHLEEGFFTAGERTLPKRPAAPVFTVASA